MSGFIRGIQSARHGTAAAVAASLLPAAIGLTTLAAGCQASGSGKPTASPTSSPRPTPPPLAAQVGGLDLTLLDKQGRPVARLKAKAGEFHPLSAAPSASPTSSPGISAIGQLTGSAAVLYKDGKPSAQMTADSVQADQATQTVTGIGNVEVHSLVLPKSPAIRADKMVWQHATGTIQGTGNVLITRAPDLRIPGTSFTADTQLRTFHLTGGNGPATGTL